MYCYSLTPMPVDLFKGVPLTVRVCFGLIYDRWKTSEYNMTHGDLRFYDQEEDSPYTIYQLDELAESMGVSKRTATDAVAYLKREGFINVRRPSFSSPNRIYIHPYVHHTIKELCRLKVVE